MKITLNINENCTVKEAIKEFRKALKDAKTPIKNRQKGFVVVMNRDDGGIASPFSRKDEFKVGKWMTPSKFIDESYNIAFTKKKDAIKYASILIKCVVWKAELDGITEPSIDDDYLMTGWAKHWNGVNINRFKLIEPLD